MAHAPWLLAALLAVTSACRINTNGMGGGGAANADPDPEVPIDPAAPMPEGSYTTDAILELGVEGRVTIDGRSDIYSAGEAAPDPGRGGKLPARIQLAPGGSMITFGRVTGKAGCQAEAAFGADGGDCAGGDTDLLPAAGLSGIIAHDRTLFMVGVFLGPPSADPGGDDHTGNVDFASYAPKLNQVFFIGDGHTSGGVAQQFLIPEGATFLYLGYADGYSFQGEPGAYGDNTGGLNVRLTQQ